MNQAGRVGEIKITILFSLGWIPNAKPGNKIPHNEHTAPYSFMGN